MSNGLKEFLDIHPNMIFDISMMPRHDRGFYWNSSTTELSLGVCRKGEVNWTRCRAEGNRVIRDLKAADFKAATQALVPQLLGTKIVN